MIGFRKPKQPITGSLRIPKDLSALGFMTPSMLAALVPTFIENIGGCFYIYLSDRQSASVATVKGIMPLHNINGPTYPFYS